MKRHQEYRFTKAEVEQWGTKSSLEIADETGIHVSTIGNWRRKYGIVSDYSKRWEEREKQFDLGLSFCGSCKKYLPLACFAKVSRNKFGVHNYCRECRRINNREYARKEERIAQRKDYYKRNHEEIRRKSAEFKVTRRDLYLRQQKKQSVRYAQIKQEFVGLMGGCCSRCGYKEFSSGFDFHHIDPSEKKGTVSKFMRKEDREALVIELDKCAALCRNCHSALHASAWSGEFEKREGLGWQLKKINN